MACDMYSTAPFTAPEVDLRDFHYMPLDVVRLRDSDTAVMTSGDGFRAAVLLWCAAWHQLPAASLPDDDRLLANYAGFGRAVAAWMAIREEALRGFVKCSDGRLYHATIAEKAKEAWESKLQRRKRTEAARAARHVADKATVAAPEPAAISVTETVASSVTETVAISVTEAVASSVTEAAAASVTSSRGEERKEEESSLRSDISAPRKASRAKPRTRIGEAAQPTEKDRAFAVECGMDVAVFREEWAQFRDYHIREASLMADWEAAWRTWGRNWKNRRPRAGPRAAPFERRNPALQAGAELIAEIYGTAPEQDRDHDQLRLIAG